MFDSSKRLLKRSPNFVVLHDSASALSTGIGAIMHDVDMISFICPDKELAREVDNFVSEDSNNCSMMIAASDEYNVAKVPSSRTEALSSNC